MDSSFYPGPNAYVLPDPWKESLKEVCGQRKESPFFKSKTPKTKGSMFSIEPTVEEPSIRNNISPKRERLVVSPALPGILLDSTDGGLASPDADNGDALNLEDFFQSQAVHRKQASTLLPNLAATSGSKSSRKKLSTPVGVGHSPAKYRSRDLSRKEVHRSKVAGISIGKSSPPSLWDQIAKDPDAHVVYKRALLRDGNVIVFAVSVFAFAIIITKIILRFLFR